MTNVNNMIMKILYYLLPQNNEQTDSKGILKKGFKILRLHVHGEN